MDKIELGTPFRTVIIKILSCNPKMLSVFGRTKEKDLFFKELLTIGCDFYELLELFANCEAINNEKYSSDRDTLRVECKSAVFHADFLLLRLSRFSNSTGSAASS